MKQIELRRALILDTETTGLEPPPKGDAIEVAVTLFDLEHAQPVESFASLIYCDHNEAVRVNGISIALLKTAPPSPLVWSHVKALAGRAEVVIAHNAEFDRQFTVDLGIPWVCSEEDIQWPHRKARGGSLAYLALSLGVGVASAHRAMADVDTLSRIFTRLAEQGCDLKDLIRQAMRPKALFQALVPYSEKDLAKEHGFRWEPEPKMWRRRMAVDDASKLPFKVRRVR